MPKAFDSSDFSNYPEIMRLCEASGVCVCEHTEHRIDSDAFYAHIEKAEQLKQVAVFHNVDMEEIRFSDREFRVPILLTKCRMRGEIRFTRIQFVYKIFFHDVVFQRMLRFRLSYFFHGASFLDCRFEENVSFERAKFLASNIRYLRKEATEEEEHFPQAFRGRNTVDFFGVTFYKSLSFVNAHFNCSILFTHYLGHSTKFYGECDFSCISDEKEDLILDTLHVLGAPRELALDGFHRIAFIGVEFFHEVTFENRIFQKRTIFKDSIFHKAPKFHNAELHQDTDFRGSDFRDTYSEGAERAYRTLKLIMDKKRARREEGMFFALEQKSILNSPLRVSQWKVLDKLRSAINRFIIRCVFTKEERSYRTSTPVFDPDTRRYSGFYVSLTEKILSFFYFLISNYGRSFKRPILLLILLVFGIFPVVYMSGFSEIKAINNSWGMAYQVSLQQMFRPFEIYTVRFREHYEDTPINFYALASVESLFNLGFVTLFALAVRGRFRMY